LVGNFKNPGSKWDRTPTPVNDHDFRSQAQGVAILYGIYDPEANRGALFVGVSHETSSIRGWWLREGRERYHDSKHLLILADTGGSNSATRRAWKDQLQQLCDGTGLTITVAHYPTGASKLFIMRHPKGTSPFTNALEGGCRGFRYLSAQTKRIEIEEILSAAVNTANEQRKQAVAEFLEVTAAVPHDSSADGILLIEKAGAARQQAFDEYQLALNRFMDFVVSGIVPDDLK